MTLTHHRAGGAYYARTPDTRRTRRYLTIAAATRAAERGELFTDAEYDRLMQPTPTAHVRQDRTREAIETARQHEKKLRMERGV